LRHVLPSMVALAEAGQSLRTSARAKQFQVHVVEECSKRGQHNHDNNTFLGERYPFHVGQSIESWKPSNSNNQTPAHSAANEVNPAAVEAYPKTFLAKAMPSMRATGVRLTRSVTSPTAYILGTEVWLNPSTLICPLGPNSIPTCSDNQRCHIQFCV